ncbi:MAG: hypothetical protein Q8R35_03315 [bacterium]|nr:hypothetical protein [bacterium]
MTFLMDTPATIAAQDEEETSDDEETISESEEEEEELETEGVDASDEM